VAWKTERQPVEIIETDATRPSATHFHTHNIRQPRALAARR
jgi:hypothetical protein